MSPMSSCRKNNWVLKALFFVHVCAHECVHGSGPRAPINVWSSKDNRVLSLHLDPGQCALPELQVCLRTSCDLLAPSSCCAFQTHPDPV